MKFKHRTIGHIVLILIILILFLLPFLFEGIRDLFTPNAIRGLLINAGVFGYLIIILLILAANPLPIPGTAVILAGGYVYGLMMGSLVSLIGIILGASVSFLLVRKFGRPLLEKLVDEHHIRHFDHIFKKRGLVVALISYAVPIFPSDAVSLLLGLTRTKFSTFLGLVILGHIPRVLIINSLGGDLYSGLKWSTFFILLGCLIFVLITIFRERLKKVFFKELHVLEKEAKVVEREVEYIEGEVGLKRKKYDKKAKIAKH